MGRYNRGYKSYERTMLIHYLANHKDKNCLFICKTLYSCEKIELELEQNYIDYETEFKNDYYNIYVNKR
jgi:hypothetical protein